MSQTAADASTAQDATSTPPGADTPPAAQQPASAPQDTWDGKVESLPQGVQDLIKGLRTENADKRTKAKSAEDDANAKITAALKALGIDDGGDDPLKAAQQAAETAASERDTAQRARLLADAELIVWRSAADLKVNAAALTDSRAFEAAITKLDPTADDFAARVKEAAQAAAETNPLLKAQVAAGKSGVEFTGGTGEQAPKPKNLTEALGRVYGQ